MTWTSLSMDVSTSAQGRTTRRTRPRKRTGASPRAIFERPGVRGRCRQTSSCCATIVERDPRSALEDVAGEEFKGEGARCLAGTILERPRWQRTHARFSKGPVFEDVAAKPCCVTRPSLGETHGRRSRTFPVESTREEFKDEGVRCFDWDDLGKVSLAAYARAIFERPGVRARRRQTSSCRTAIVGRDPRPALEDVSGR